MTSLGQDPSTSSYGLLSFKGSDASKFLQGQLSNDMNLLDEHSFVLAGYHNPQGRVLALLRLAALAPDHLIALLPLDVTESTLAALRRYVLRAKVVISNESSAAALAELGARLPAAESVLAPDARARNISLGIPQVYAATSGMFVAQMLNLDCVQAISFTKGCYTGQEIIARSHYRGRIKRRMQRFLTDHPAALIPGQGVTLSDGRAAQIVDATVQPSGRCEFLAVTTLPVPAPSAPTTGVSPPLPCSMLPLPYELPE